MSDPARLPVDIVTGFLGAGKTTLLRRVIAQEAAGETAVLVNEFGEIGLDQFLFETIAPDVVLLESGCVCCQIRGEIKDAIVSLLERRAKGETPPFRRIVLEASGLSEPAPLLSTFISDPILAHRTFVRRTIAVVDVQALAAGPGRAPEWMAQVTAADGLALAKLDLVDEAAAAAVQAELAGLNPTAVVFPSVEPDGMDGVAGARGFGRPTPVVPLVNRAAHGAVDTAWLRLGGPVDWPALAVCLSAVLHFHGEKILRTKGLIDIGAAGPLVLNGVQHVMHRPEHLDAWPDEDHGSRIVFITRSLPAARIADAMADFLAGGAAQRMGVA